MIAAGTYESGRVFVAGHEAMLTADQASNLAKLVRNAAKWVAGGKATDIRIATNDDGWTSTLAAIASQVRWQLFATVAADRCWDAASHTRQSIRWRDT